MSEDTLKGLRRLKEEARQQGGAHNMVTSDKQTLGAMGNAHSAYTIRLNEEKKRQSEIQAKLKAAEERKQAEQQWLQAAQSKDHKIDKDAQKLKKEKEVTERELQVAKNLQKMCTTKCKLH